MRKMYEREKITIERVFYFVVFCLDDGWLCVMFAWLRSSARADSILFNAFVILFYIIDRWHISVEKHKNMFIYYMVINVDMPV